MPGAHRQDDLRRCGATTTVTEQSTVFVNDKLWAVENDKCTHQRGDLVPLTGSTVFCEDKKVIVAIGDTAKPDLQGHGPGVDDPSGKSTDVFAYG